jgi:purine-cytosine permease-like protein
MVWFQRVFAVLLSAALIVVIAFILADNQIPSGGSHVFLSPCATVAALFTACAAIASGRSVFRHVFRASYLPSLALTATGAICATLGDMSDPVSGLKPFIPGWLFIVYIFAVVGGSLANNIPTYYSSGLTLQAIGLKLHRNVPTALDVPVSTAIALYVLFVQDFSSALNDFIAVLIVWVGPYGGVWICDGYLRRGKLDFHAIHSMAGTAGRYWGWHGLNLPGCIALLAGMTAAALTMKSPLYDGPIALALGGTDLSWLVGVPVSALVYAGLTLLGERRRAHALGLAAD